MTDTQRLNFLELILSTGIPLGFKPGPKALIGSVYVEGAVSIRDLIDKIKLINDGKEPIPNADTSLPRQETD
jgi:hypothetical protein